MYILREDFNISYPLIGQKTWWKRPYNCYSLVFKDKNDLKDDPRLVGEIEQIRTMFK